MLPEERQERRHQLAQIGFQAHAATFTIVNLLLIAIWALTGAGTFWPIWPIVGWGAAMSFHAWATYGRPRR